MGLNRLKVKAGRASCRFWLAAGALGVITAVSALSPAASGATSSAGPAAEQPNVVLIQADDQTAAQFNRKVMPKTTRLLARPGATFTDYIVTTPQCCPSRASLLTGQYAHNHGVLSNSTGYPGLVDKDNVLPVWLQQAGYNTIHVGKFLNGYTRFVDDPGEIAPGWTDWRTVVGGSWRTASGGRFGYYRYFMAKNGRKLYFGKRKRNYITRVLTHNASSAIRRYAPLANPFYLQVDEHAPHGSGGRRPGRCSGRRTRAAKPDPRDMDAFRKARLRHPPSFNEREMGDKPPFMQGLPRLSREAKGNMREKWRCALASLVGVDRSVANIYRAVKRAGELHNTVFIYLSDNGEFYGEHRIEGGKVLPYEEAVRQPLVIKVPPGYRGGQPRVGEVHQPVANVDLAPTILDFAHASPCPPAGACRTMDGRSMVPLLTGTGQWPDDRGLLTEYRSYASPRGRYRTCRYAGVRTRSSVYVEYYDALGSGSDLRCAGTLAVERYDLAEDPFELRNLCYGGAPERCPTDPEQTSLQELLHRLSRCAGIAGRDEQVEDRPFCD